MFIQRTTLKLDRELYRLAKKRAVDEDVDLQVLINEALERYLRRDKKTAKEKKFEFGSFDLGGLKTKIDRQTIYENRPKFSLS